MESPNILCFTKSQLEAINACRLYLQKTSLSEISNKAGTHILQNAIKGKLNQTKTEPLLWQISRSTLDWPYQLRPPAPAWNLWKKLLLTFATNTPTNQLQHPLGEWLSTVHDQRQWKYQYYDDDIIQLTNLYKYYKILPSRHHHKLTKYRSNMW
jgi:hypothetical protein